MQTTLKWPPVMLADKGCFGDWVKRQMNYQNKTKNRTPPKQNKKTKQKQKQKKKANPTTVMCTPIF